MCYYKKDFIKWSGNLGVVVWTWKGTSRPAQHRIGNIGLEPPGSGGKLKFTVV